jgi:hypothetical protein
VKRSGCAFPVAMNLTPSFRMFPRWRRGLLVAGSALATVLQAAAAGHGGLRVTPLRGLLAGYGLRYEGLAKEGRLRPFDVVGRGR